MYLKNKKTDWSGILNQQPNLAPFYSGLVVFVHRDWLRTEQVDVLRVSTLRNSANNFNVFYRGGADKAVFQVLHHGAIKFVDYIK